jgi:hypothetical protein
VFLKERRSVNPVRILRDHDVNGGGHTDVLDVFYLISFLFAGGPSPFV